MKLNTEMRMNKVIKTEKLMNEDNDKGRLNIKTMTEE
jgi:hypothetical protein